MPFQAEMCLFGKARNADVADNGAQPVIQLLPELARTRVLHISQLSGETTYSPKIGTASLILPSRLVGFHSLVEPSAADQLPPSHAAVRDLWKPGHLTVNDVRDVGLRAPEDFRHVVDR